MKSTDYKEVGKLLEHYRELQHLRTCGEVYLQLKFLWVTKVIPVSMEAANLSIDEEKRKTAERLKELGVEVNE
jgi:hypothetical protein